MFDDCLEILRVSSRQGTERYNLFTLKEWRIFFNQELLNTYYAQKTEGCGMEEISMQDECVLYKGCEVSKCKKSPIMLIS